jgi:hypothetical protein
MSSSPSVIQAAHVHTHSCHSEPIDTPFDSILNVVEKISAIALGIFSAYINVQVFVPFFLAGASIGAYGYTQDSKSCQDSVAGSSCAHGLIEQLTQVKLPRVVSLIANVAVTVCHIDHHESVFVPIIAISMGNWIGKVAMISLHNGSLARFGLSF